MLELRYIEIDENGFITSISTQETETSIGVYLDPNSEMVLGFRKYRYDIDNDEFIYDESKVINECKESLKLETERNMRFNKNNQFGVKLDAGNFTFDYSDQLKNNISNNNGLMSLGLTSLFKISCINDDNKKTSVKLGLADFIKLIKATVEFSDCLENQIEERLSEIEEMESINDIVNFKNKFNIK